MRSMVTVLMVVLAAALALAACADDGAEPTTTTATTSPPTTITTTSPTTTTTTSPTTTATLDPEVALEAEVLAEVDVFVEAWYAADVDGVFDLIQPSLSDAERFRQGFFVAWNFAPISGCEIDSLSDFITTVVCEAESSDPVYAEMGPTELNVVLSRYGDGYNVNFDNGGGGRQYADTLDAYAEYLSQYEPDAYAVTCDREGYEMEIRFEYGTSLTPECGALLLTEKDAVAEWIRNGRPEA